METNNSKIEFGYKSVVIFGEKFPFLKFKKDNQIPFFKDMNFWRDIPAGICFYIDRFCQDGVWLIADGYGVQSKNRFGLTGEYGSGAIAVDFAAMPPEVEAFCREALKNT